MKKYLIASVVFCFALIGFVSLMSTQGSKPVLAATPYLSGWAWSSNIGWVSFNNSDTSGASCADYCVKIDTTTNTLSGYAWSSNIGWIQFGYLSNAPDGTNNNATIVGGSGPVTGWVRACGGTVGRNCTSATRTDGWDGWIKLSGTANNGQGYGVNFNGSTGVFSGFAWGGDVVGWLNFNAGVAQDGSPVPGVNCTSTCGGPPPVLTASCGITNTTFNTDGSYASVTFGATETSGVGPFTYKWYVDGSVDGTHTNATAQYAYPPEKDYTSDVKVEVTDSTGAKSTGNCTGVYVSAPPSGGNSFSLQAGPSAGLARNHGVNNPLVVKQGSPFTLVRNIKLPVQYDRCDPLISGGAWAWTVVSVANGDPANSPYVETGTETNNNTTGTYQFSIRCKNSVDPGIPATTTSAYVKIISVHEEEH